jgi:hypothetical protein
LEAKTGIQQTAEESKLLPPDTESHPDPTVRLGWDPKIAYVHEGEVATYEKAHIAWLAEHRPELLATYPERKKEARAEYVETVLDRRNRIFGSDGSFKYEPLSPEQVAHLRSYVDGPMPEELQ